MAVIGNTNPKINVVTLLDTKTRLALVDVIEKEGFKGTLSIETLLNSSAWKNHPDYNPATDAKSFLGKLGGFNRETPKTITVDTFKQHTEELVLEEQRAAQPQDSGVFSFLRKFGARLTGAQQGR